VERVDTTHTVVVAVAEFDGRGRTSAVAGFAPAELLELGLYLGVGLS
jgi:hypothetical protein